MSQDSARFRLIGVSGGRFVIADMSDESVDFCSFEETLQFCKLGIFIGGINYKDGEEDFEYTDDYFMHQESDTENEDAEDGYEEQDLADSEDYADGYEDEYDDLLADADNTESIDSDTFDDYDIYGDYDEDDILIDEDTDVNKLYKLLTEEQKDALKRFYLWSAQILFDSVPSGGILKATSKRIQYKNDKLAELKKAGKTWVYAGFIDLEFHGAGHCTLGHALRYEHFAWDADFADINTDFWAADLSAINWNRLNALIDSGHVIKFGIECVGDFFEVPKESLAKIKEMQRQSIVEMGELYAIYSDATKFANVKESFRVFEMFADRLVTREAKKKLTEGSNYEPSEDAKLFTFYKEFKKLGMLYPRMMVKRLQDVLLQRRGHKFKNFRTPDSKVISEALDLLNIQIPNIKTEIKECNFGWHSLARVYMENLIAIQSGGIYAYNPYSVLPRDRDEGGKNKDSRSEFSSITGASDSDEVVIREVMTTYNFYPFLFNQFRASDFMRRGIDWSISYTLEEIQDLERVYVLMNKYADSLPIGDSGTAKTKDGSDSDKILILDSYWLTNKGVLSYDYLNEYNFKTMWNRVYPDFRLGSTASFVIDKYRFSGSAISLKELGDVLEAYTAEIQKRVSTFQEAIREYEQREFLDDCDISKMWDLRHLSPDEAKEARSYGREGYKKYLAEKKKKEERDAAKAQGVQNGTDNAADNNVNDVNSTNIADSVSENLPTIPKLTTSSTPKECFDYCVAAVQVKGVYASRFESECLIKALSYAAQGSMAQRTQKICNSISNLVLQILGTVSSSSNKFVSSKQTYWLKRGLIAVICDYIQTNNLPSKYIIVCKDLELIDWGSLDSTQAATVQSASQKTDVSAEQSNQSEEQTEEQTVEQTVGQTVEQVVEQVVEQSSQSVVEFAKPESEEQPVIESTQTSEGTSESVRQSGIRNKSMGSPVFSLYERKDIAADINLVLSNMDALRNMTWEKRSILVRLANICRKARSSGSISESDYEYIKIAKDRLSE